MYRNVDDDDDDDNETLLKQGGPFSTRTDIQRGSVSIKLLRTCIQI